MSTVAREKRSISSGGTYRIGISIFVNGDGKLSLFENGLRQNVLFLYHLFSASARCEKVYLLNHGDGEPVDPEGEAGVAREAIVRTGQVLDELDFVISMGAALDVETVAACKQRRIPVISYKCGNGGVIAMEGMCAQPPRGDAERYFDADFYDAVWMTPQHIHTYRGWCETVYRAPVHEVPHIWSPHFIELREAALGSRFVYRPGRERWRVGILDPNITIMKTSHLPMLVCEAAYRERPGAFEAIYVANGMAHASNAHFVSFYSALSAGRAGIMTLEPRFVGIDMIANHCDAIVTHHWQNGLNYLYYEALYGGYPLIHNSTMLGDAGYYYPDFDAMAGGARLREAFDRHDRDIGDYRRATSALMARIDPTAHANIAYHEALLERLAEAAGR